MKFLIRYSVFSRVLEKTQFIEFIIKHTTHQDENQPNSIRKIQNDVPHKNEALYILLIISFSHTMRNLHLGCSYNIQKIQNNSFKKPLPTTIQNSYQF
jgi:hypothetical protein